MADRELAIKLEKRLAKLNDEFDDPSNSVLSSPAVTPESPVPPPSQKQQTPPLLPNPNDEFTDMDQLIGRTLHALQITSRKAPANLQTWVDYTPELFRKNLSPAGSLNGNPAQQPEGIHSCRKS